MISNDLCCYWLQLDLLIPAECCRDLMRLYGCQYCQLASSALPCQSSCTVVVDRCFAGLAVFGQEWDIFIGKFWLLICGIIFDFKYGTLSLLTVWFIKNFGHSALQSVQW